MLSNHYKTVLIAGSTGLLGYKIANAFLDKKIFDVRIIVRKSSDKSDQLKAKGAEVFEIDFKDSEALKKATSGVDAVISALSNDGFGFQPALIEAAAASGVKRFIPSEFGASIQFFPPGTVSIIDFKWQTRDLIKKSGMEYTFISNHIFMEYMFSPFGGIDFQNSTIEVFGTDVTFSTIHTDDIARLVPEILLNPKTKNSEVYLGTEIFKWDDLVGKLEKSTGKTWTKKIVTEEALSERIASSQDFGVTLGSTLQRQALKLKSTLGTYTLDNLTDPFYAATKKDLIKIDDYLVQLSKKN